MALWMIQLGTVGRGRDGARVRRQGPELGAARREPVRVEPVRFG